MKGGKREFDSIPTYTYTIRKKTLFSKFFVRSAIDENSPNDMCMNCAFYDKSMTFGTKVEHINITLFGYRAISDFEAILQNGRRKHIFSYRKNCVK